MSNFLTQDRLEALHEQVRPVVRDYRNKHARLVYPKRPTYQMDAIELSNLIDEVRQRRGRRTAFRTAMLTDWMIASKVGDVILIAMRSHNAITTNRRTARRKLDNPDAKWTCITLPNGTMRIERVAEDAPVPKRWNPISFQMAEMNVNGVIIVEYGGRLPNTFRVHAREKMNNPHAQWRGETLANGKLRITRKSDKKKEPQITSTGYEADRNIRIGR